MSPTESTLRTPNAVIAVFERTPYAGPELQRQFLGTSVTVRECRLLSDLLPAVEDAATHLFVIDLEADVAGCLEWVRSLGQTGVNHHPIVACGAPDKADLEWVLREAGVSVILNEAIPGDQFARLCRRQLGIAGRIRSS